MLLLQNLQGLVVVGGGPAGLAPLFAATNAGMLDALLDAGVTLLERGTRVGPGALGGYSIRSDSSAEALLDIVLRSTDLRLAALRSHPLTQELARYNKGSAPLKTVGRFLELASGTLCELITASCRGQVITGAVVHWLQMLPNGTWRTHYTDADGRAHDLTSHNVVASTGAHQPLERLHREFVAGLPLLPTFESNLLQSGDVLGEGGLAQVAARLRHKAVPKVAVIGGSTSAAAVALALLSRLPEVNFGHGGVTLLHRKPLRIFYETVAEALQDGYTEFTADDVCAITGRVFRLSGFRLDSRKLIMSARGIAGSPPEPRLRLLKLDPQHHAEARRHLSEADLVIAALGYRPRLLPVFSHSMQPVPLLRPNGRRWAVVDRRSRLLTAEGHALPGLFALGLAIGPAANPALGGELGFNGQVNSLWLWQHTLGRSIAEQVVQRLRDYRSPVDTMHLLTLNRPAVPAERPTWTAQAQAAGVP